MGIEHDRIHLERSMNLLGLSPLDMVRAAPGFSTFPLGAAPTPPNALVHVRGGCVDASRSDCEPDLSFGWDNEFGEANAVHLCDFSVGSMLVSNAEYREFVDAGGYMNPEYWSEQSSAWISQALKREPPSWLAGNKLRTMLETVPMQDSWPAIVSHFEAEAFCRWKSENMGIPLRLISRPEWLLLRRRLQSTSYNVGMRYYSPCPVHEHGEPLGASGEMVYDIMGNAWEHSASPFNVMPGFKPHPFYADYTAEFDGAHFFILGGSWASTGCLAGPHARQCFRRHRYQLAGFRYVSSQNNMEDDTLRLEVAASGVVTPDEVLDFWFDGDAKQQQLTSQKFPPNNAVFDDEVVRRFGATVAAAVTGRLDVWTKTSAGCLALVITLSQFSRQAFRDMPGAHAHDWLARKVINDIILPSGFDASYGPAGKLFGVLLPLESSADSGDHELLSELLVRYARRQLEAETEADSGAQGSLPAFLQRDLVARAQCVEARALVL
mmetsp:Transcript_20871/g.58309  ORF Transcript_20871/g.58309 Transcript_20871/m.58309 type:complete len:494 (-) Transcript_20871:146-1627(-)